MDRRGFLGTILAACAAPAIVRADSLMRIARPTERLIIPAFGSGTIREWTQYCFKADWEGFITRWDVAGYAAGKGLMQCHVDVVTPGRGIRAEDRDTALRVLKNHVDHHGILVRRDVLELPQSETARFIGWQGS